MGNSPICMRQNEDKEEQRLRINDPRRRRKTKRGKSQTPKEKRGLGRKRSAEENPHRGKTSYLVAESVWAAVTKTP